ncbi:hypothetical protein BFJ69_g16126 [Fusarium oxysporum]|uniref:Histidine-specific methyltransferase SAM-dependent domain-containing protein n=1 Tax=Fusarium oxysporum TaxID=5507 RepID=A0A420MDQ1_FUSOX|nr:hypothetical protein BFJ69_g16126 [Fusarium oxysporum]
MPSTTDPAKVSCKRPQSITYMVQQYATVTYLPAGQNTNKSPLQELPWPSKLTPKDDLPEMDAFFSCHLVDHPNELVLYRSPFEEYSAMLENQRQLATELVTWLDDLSPGHVQDIGGGNMTQCIEKELNESIRLGKYLSKAVCYIDSPWPGGDTSPQSLGERKILREQASELAQQLYPLVELTIFDLGSGNSEKLLPIFNELEKAEKVCRYFAVDVNRASLESHVQGLSKRYNYIYCFGLHGSFEDARRLAIDMPGEKVGISCSSTLTNFEPEKVLQILQDWSQVVDRLILGQHEPVREKELESSYHTPEFTEFMRGGWDKANELLGWKEFDDTRWSLECKTTTLPQCHKFHCTPLAQPRTEFFWFACYKYTVPEFQRIIQSSGWRVSKCYRDEKTKMSMYNIIPAQKTDAGSLEGTPLARHV